MALQGCGSFYKNIYGYGEVLQCQKNDEDHKKAMQDVEKGSESQPKTPHVLMKAKPRYKAFKKNKDFCIVKSDYLDEISLIRS